MGPTDWLRAFIEVALVLLSSGLIFRNKKLRDQLAANQADPALAIAETITEWFEDNLQRPAEPQALNPTLETPRRLERRARRATDDQLKSLLFETAEALRPFLISGPAARYRGPSEMSPNQWDAASQKLNSTATRLRERASSLYGRVTH